MDCHVTVSAEFPEVEKEQLSAIYAGLARRGWEKIMTMGRDASTVWHIEYDDLTPKRAVTKANLAFTRCAGGLCKPKFVISVSEERPVRG